MATMSTQIINFPEKKCSLCRCSLPKEGFFRKGKEWKTCNYCSLKGSCNRRAQSLFFYDNLGRLTEGLQIGQPLGQVPAQLQYQQLLTEQVPFEQQQFEQQRFQTQAEQPGQRMTMDCLLNDPELYAAIPSQLYEPQRGTMHPTQQLYQADSTQAQIDQHLACPIPEPELFVPPSPDFPVNSDMGIPPPCHLVDLNLYSNFKTNGAEQDDYNFDFALGPGDPEFDFEECLTNALCADLQTMNGVEPSFFDEPSLENSIERANSMSPTKECDAKYQPPSRNFDLVDLKSAATQGNLFPTTADGPKAQAQDAEECMPKPAPARFSLDEVFANLDASQDILHQPAIPNRNLAGAALTAYLVSELGLAVRLSQLHCRWRKMKQHNFFKELNLLANLESLETITPWGPFSDVLNIYELGLEKVIDRHGYNENLDWRMENAAKASMRILARTVKAYVIQMVREAIDQNIQALLKLFLVGTDHSEHKIKTELDRQLRSLKAAVVENCEDTGVLRLKKDCRGTYIEG